MLKATNVNGVYDTDPKENPKAKKFENLTFDDAINQNLQVMDQTALAFAEIIIYKLEYSMLMKRTDLKKQYLGRNRYIT